MKELAELQQLQNILSQDGGRYLSTQILCEVNRNDLSLPVYAVTLGKRDSMLPSVTFVGGVHGLEKIGTQVVLAFLETLLERLKWDKTLHDLLKQIRINFIPLLNPVGMMNHTRANGQGVDLMRNAPLDSTEKTVWLGGGHRISPRLPWYRGKADEPMQSEAQALCDFIQQQISSSPLSVVLDCHSGFGFHNQIWFPYAKSRIEPIQHIGEMFYLRQLFQKTYPYQNYRFEPQSQHYLTHGDLWDYLYLSSLEQAQVFLPLTLEMGSWRWIRKNPLQLRKISGLFHPIKPHRVSRVLRGHLVLMDFLLRATASWQLWLKEGESETMKQQALALWYHEN